MRKPRTAVGLTLSPSQLARLDAKARLANVTRLQMLYSILNVELLRRPPWVTLH